jgi:hypothetical protein
MCYLPDENELKKRAEEAVRKMDAELALLPDVDPEALDLWERLKEIRREAEAIMDAMSGVGEPPPVPHSEENMDRLVALLEEEDKAWQEFEHKLPQEFMERLKQPSFPKSSDL